MSYLVMTPEQYEALNIPLNNGMDRLGGSLLINGNYAVTVDQLNNEGLAEIMDQLNELPICETVEFVTYKNPRISDNKNA